ncbi:MFS transporter [Agrobacterium salinitolerans]|uniref:MFS transporter n=1 Tax=Agrobacterium salinitolerans TaxID=1183413 RepID=UPI0015718CAD|nr:MFS transporter [Agrobacterium salinitolerans]NTA40375.1 MFS transporter [Agrobacterium salinitolerans]
MSNKTEAGSNRETEGYRRCDFFWFVSSCFLSSFGRNGYFIVGSWLLVSKGSGSAPVALFFTLVSLTELATSNLAGGLADKFDRRKLYVGADTIRGVALCCAASSLAYCEVYWPIYISGVVLAACDRVALTASQAAIPNFLTRHRVSTLNSLAFFLVQCGGFVGATLTGYLLHAASSETALLVMAATFGSSAVSMLLVSSTAAVKSASHPSDSRLKYTPEFCLLIIVYAVIYTGSMLISVVGPGFVSQEHSGNALDFGRLESAWSIGSIIGTLLLIPIGYALDLRTFQLVVVAGMILAFAILPLVDLKSSLLIFVALGALYNVGRVTVEVVLQTLVPVSALGRAKGILHVAAVFLGVNAFMLIGFAGENIRPSGAFLAYSIFAAAATIFALAYFRRGRP